MSECLTDEAYRCEECKQLNFQHFACIYKSRLKEKLKNLLKRNSELLIQHYDPNWDWEEYEKEYLNEIEKYSY